MRTRFPARRAGFTLVELLTVVAIIGILASLSIGGFNYFTRKQAEDKARVQIKLLETALEEYRMDNGDYPLQASSTGIGATNNLFKKLYNDGATTNGRIYLAELDPNSAKQGWIESTGGVAASKIVDPFGNEYRYRKYDMTVSGNASKQRNPDFDLWSCGADGKTNTQNPAGGTGAYNPDHSDSRDDIW